MGYFPLVSVVTPSFNAERFGRILGLAIPFATQGVRYTVKSMLGEMRQRGFLIGPLGTRILGIVLFFQHREIFKSSLERSMMFGRNVAALFQAYGGFAGGSVERGVLTEGRDQAFESLAYFHAARTDYDPLGIAESIDCLPSRRFSGE